MNFRVEHIFRGTTLPDFEKLFFDEPFNAAMCKAVQLDRTVVKHELKGDRLSRVLRVGPDREIPPTVAKILGAKKIEYTEHLDYLFGSYEATWHTVSSIMTDKIDTRGRIGFEERPNGVLRWVEGEIKVKLLGVGKVVEKLIVSDIERSYDRAAAFTQRWIDSGGKL